MSRPVLALTFGLGGLVGALLASLGASPPARSESPSFAEVVEKINPAVVHVSVVTQRGPDPHRDVPGMRRGEGSGFIVDAAGYVLTSQHVVAQPSRIRVRLADRRDLPATLVGADVNTDVALLKIAEGSLTAISLGNSDSLRVGEWVAAIGNPYQFDHSVTVGVVSSKGRKLFDASFDSYIQTDAAINPGNSGGPLVNGAGEAVGISTAVSAQGQGIGFAVPINVAREVMAQLKSQGRVARGYLGVQLHELDPDLTRQLGLPEPKGAFVLEVLPGGAGAIAGLRRYDVITAVAGREIGDGDQLVRTIAATPPGTSLALAVVRDGKPLDLTARLGERDEGGEEPPQAKAPEPGGDRLGLEMAELSPAMRAELAVPADKGGVVISDVLGLPAGADALSHGDIVVEVNRRPTPDLPAYRKAVEALGEGASAYLLVYRPRPSRTFLVRVVVEGGR